MPIDSKSITDMKAIMESLNGMSSTPVTEETSPRTNATSVSPEIDAMRVILERMSSVADDLEHDAKYDSTLREAMDTEETVTGARIGSWEIVTHTDGNRKIFDVVNIATSEPIATDLMLYEAAVSLARKLNEGASITSPAIKNILLLEEDYVRARNDAEVFKARSRSAISKGEPRKAAIAEDRYDEAQRKALDAHERIIALAGIRL